MTAEFHLASGCGDSSACKHSGAAWPSSWRVGWVSPKPRQTRSPLFAACHRSASDPWARSSCLPARVVAGPPRRSEDVRASLFHPSGGKSSVKGAGCWHCNVLNANYQKSRFRNLFTFKITLQQPRWSGIIKQSTVSSPLLPQSLCSPVCHFPARNCWDAAGW